MDYTSTTQNKSREASDTFKNLSAKAAQIAGGSSMNKGMLDRAAKDNQDLSLVRDHLHSFGAKCADPLGHPSSGGDEIAGGVAWGYIQDAKTAAETEGAHKVSQIIQQQLEQPFEQAFMAEFGSHPRMHAIEHFESTSPIE